jgi:hydroxymethylpyrimidine pyrophosphatase-like HAD family hydrolase
LTSAHFAAFLHARFTGQIAQTLTPFELASTSQQLSEVSVLICSAGGSNPDVIAGASIGVQRNPRQLFAVTTKSRSPLQMRLSEAGWPVCHAYATPTRKDGFLATNSLLATIILLARAYESWAGTDSSLPDSVNDLLHPGTSRSTFVSGLGERLRPLVRRSTLIVLHGASTKPAAMDVESRFTEAALAHVQPADYRNFAHGRHHWLARYANTSAVLAFSEAGESVVQKTLALIPAEIPKYEFRVEPGVPGAIAGICYSIFLASVGGEARGIDPGRPHVPTFGRRLYHLRAMPGTNGAAGDAVQRMNLAIERKTQLPISALAARGELDRWREHYRAFVERLATARFGAIVLDYDGTLCGPERRLAGPSDEVIARIAELLDSGLIVAIATGRGKSVREELRKRFRSADHRARVIVGYHNGAEIGPLSDTQCPPAEPPLIAELDAIAEALRASGSVARSATIQAKGNQVTLELLPFGDANALLAEASRAVRGHGGCAQVSIVTSSHSVDIIAAGVSKSNVIREVLKDLAPSGKHEPGILCVGDRGRAPGNDADLLRYPLSLSVDEVSDDPLTCWTVAAPAARFDIACLEYLTRLRPGKSGARFDVKGVTP